MQAQTESRRRPLSIFIPTPPLDEVGDQPHGLAAAPIVQEAGLDSGPVWLCAENLSSTGFKTRNLPARS